MRENWYLDGEGWFCSQFMRFYNLAFIVDFRLGRVVKIGEYSEISKQIIRMKCLYKELGVTDAVLSLKLVNIRDGRNINDALNLANKLFMCIQKEELDTVFKEYGLSNRR